MTENTERDPIREAAEAYLEEQTRGAWRRWPNGQADDAMQDFTAGWRKAEARAALSRPVPEDTTDGQAMWARKVLGMGDDEPNEATGFDVREAFLRLTLTDTPPVPVTGGVDLEAIESHWHSNCVSGCKVPALVAEVRALRSRLSPPTREALVNAIKEAWGDKTIRRDGAHHYVPPVRDRGATDQLIQLAVDTMLAALSSPETEGEKN